MMMTEAAAASVMYRVVRQGKAAEFMEHCVFDGGMFTQDPDGTVHILTAAQTSGLLGQLGVSDS
jgi:hypothetical protein